MCETLPQLQPQQLPLISPPPLTPSFALSLTDPASEASLKLPATVCGPSRRTASNIATPVQMRMHTYSSSSSSRERAMEQRMEYECEHALSQAVTAADVMYRRPACGCSFLPPPLGSCVFSHLRVSAIDSGAKKANDDAETPHSLSI